MVETPCEGCLIAVYCTYDVSGRCLRRELEGGSKDEAKTL
ncbi:hypothetical protein SDC9_163755 [bioreactor metagenome]|uniref:Uncharacterized protein n=1 Tax=bioreactor metagenome TaxID=1076179 RepID=A0A645FPS2_9ZZZZ